MEYRHASEAIASCATQLDLACQFLDASVTQLGEAVTDLPRLQRVTSLRRCYQLATEGEVRNAQYQLVSEIEPPIRELISRAEAGLGQLKRRERALAAQATPKPSEELQQRLIALQEQREALMSKNAELELDLETAGRSRTLR